jgi:2-keto-4-pentenoate hydratase/2-oxohepta-3-ene-1,7-dioic acid hydratase in catechol pathway
MNRLGRALLGETSCHGEIEDERFHVVSGDLFAGYRRTGESMPMTEVALGTPIEDVRFVNVMGGFVEPGATRPSDRDPWWLPKATRYPSGEGAEVRRPASLTGAMVMESELSVVVGRELRNASPSEAHDAVFGWSVFNDWTATEFGNVPAVGLWAAGKSVDGFTSWGPWIRRDLSEERVMEGLAINGYINGEQSQAGNTKHFAFTPSEMLSHISRYISLFPGDVVALGTPYPAPEVTVGDHVVCEVEEVGVLNNFVVADSDEPRSVLPRRVPSTATAR